MRRHYSKKGGRSPYCNLTLDGTPTYIPQGTQCSYVCENADCDTRGTERLLARPATTVVKPSASLKTLVHSESVEVVISEPRILSWGSQFGHVAIIVDGRAYSRAPERYFVTDKHDYLSRNAFRDSVGYIIRVSPHEKGAIKGELERRVHLFAAAPESQKYSLLDNNCSSTVATVLQQAGIVAHDPRWLMAGIISPADLVTGLNHSQRLARKVQYPKTR